MTDRHDMMTHDRMRWG